jgi:hypothetical protein
MYFVQLRIADSVDSPRADDDEKEVAEAAGDCVDVAGDDILEPPETAPSKSGLRNSVEIEKLRDACCKACVSR